jgi:hypothetical protein
VIGAGEWDKGKEGKSSSKRAAILPASPDSTKPSNQVVETRKPDRLNALTGLRSFAAVNIVFFHFSNPQWFGIFAPIVNAGYAW